MSYDDFGGASSFTSGAADRSAAKQVSNFQASQTSGGDDPKPSVGFTRGEDQPGGGTLIRGNTITGGRIISDTTLGRGDYDRNSQQYKDYLESTGRSLQNPYGNQGLFSRVFGAKSVNYNLDPTTAQNILDAGFQRFTNFEGQDELSQKRGFGSLFGGPEGEMTAQGEVRKQVTPMTTQESMGRALASVMGLGLPTAMVEGDNVGYTPMGGGQYNPQLDPQVNPDVASGGGIMGLLSGGADVGGLSQTLKDQLIQAKDIITSKFNPPEVAAQQNKAMGPVPTFDSRAPDAMSQNMLQQKLPTAAEEIQTMNLSSAGDLRGGYNYASKDSGLSEKARSALFDRSGSSFAAPSAPSGIGNPMATAEIFNVRDPGVKEGMRKAGVPQYKLDELESLMGRSGQATFDTDTGKAQISFPGTARGFSFDYGSDIGVLGSRLDDILGSLTDVTSGVDMTGRRVTGSGDFQEGPAFLQGIGTLNK